MNKSVLFLIAVSLWVAVPSYGMQNFGKNAFGKTKKVNWDKIIKDAPKGVPKSTFNNNLISKKNSYSTIPKQMQMSSAPTISMQSAKSWLSWDGLKKLIASKLWDEKATNWTTVVVENPMLHPISEPVQEGIIAVKIPDSWRNWVPSNPAKILPKKVKKDTPFGSGKKTFGFASGIFKQAQNNSRISMIRSMHTKAKIDPAELALGGALASENTPEAFVRLLHDNDLTVADSVRLQVEGKKEQYLQQIFKEAKLSYFQQRACRSILNLKHEWMEKYALQSAQDASNSEFSEWKDENAIESKGNLNFKGKFHPYIKAIIEDVCKKRGLHFTLIVSLVTLAQRTLGDSAGAPIKGTTFNSELPFKYNVKTGKAKNIKFGNDERLGFRLNSHYWGDGRMPSREKFAVNEEYDASLFVQHVIEHELVHVEKQHDLERTLLWGYLHDIKKISDEALARCEEIFVMSHEYEADIAPLETESGALAACQFFLMGKYRGGDRLSAYIPHAEGYALADRARELYKAEKIFLQRHSLKRVESH